MKVVIIKSFKGLGLAGEVCDVADGYARNFLIPQAIVEPLTRAAQAKLLARAQKKKKEVQKKFFQTHNTIKAIQEKIFEIKAKANKEKHLFAQINTIQIWDALKRNKIEINQKDIYIEEPIKALGPAKAYYKPTPKEKVTIKLKIIPEG